MSIVPFSTPERLSQFGAPSVWLEFSPLANACEAVNLGQGFPGWDPPEFVTALGQEMLGQGCYAQYARSAGTQILTQAVARHYGPQLRKTIRWDQEVLVTVGCSEAILLAFMGILDPGDEVILLEPAFDIYGGALAMIGGKARYVPLELGVDGKFHLDLQKLEAAITPRTKAFLLNTPHNPTGKVFSADELAEIAKLLKKHPQIIVISDEVYEHLVYESSVHTPFATLPGMDDRTLSLYSAGKTFSITGWKIGWVIGPETLVRRLQICQQWVVFSVATPLQAAVAHCLDIAPKSYQGCSSYYQWLQQDYQTKRNFLMDGLTTAGLTPIKPEGSFFIPVDLSQVPPQFAMDPPRGYQDFIKLRGIPMDPITEQRLDYNFCRHLSLRQRVTPIPFSAFSDPALGRETSRKNLPQTPLARFAFCKPLEQLAEAGRRLALTTI